MSRKLIAKARNLLAHETKARTGEQPSSRDGGKRELYVALAYPHRYYTAMSNLGFQTVYQLFNDQPQTVCERVYWPDPEDLAEYRRTGTPLFTLESQQPVRTMDILAFSISYENDYPHLLQMMELAGIPLRSQERRERDPLVMAGGSTVLMNPEPLAEFVDFFVIGEAEVIVAPLVQILREGKIKGQPKEELLRELMNLEGIYVPAFYACTYGPEGTRESRIPLKNAPSRVKRVWLKNLNNSLTASSFLTPHTELSDMYLLELSRGCHRRCRFCASCYTYFPPRVRDGPLLGKTVLRDSGPGTKVGLVGAAISDYPDLVPLGREVLQSLRTLSFSSLRVDSLTPELADLVCDSGQKTLTLAPEAGSERMRRIIGKGFTEPEIIRAAEILTDRGVRSFRLYFMIGLPGEMAEDIKGIVDLAKKIRHHIREKSRGKRGTEKILLSLNCFVPKPGTPFQWHPFENVRSLNEKMKAVERGLRKEKGVTVAADLPKWSYLQTLLARGDRRVGKILLAAHRLDGNWPQVYRSVDVNPDFYVYRERGRDEIFPWDFIDHGISKEWLWAEYQRAVTEAGALLPEKQSPIHYFLP